MGKALVRYDLQVLLVQSDQDGGGNAALEERPAAVRKGVIDRRPADG